MTSKLIDISQTLSSGIDVWPGDTPFQSFWVMRMDDGDSCNVGSVTMSLHTGTHADAPKHFLEQGSSPADCDLNVYMGLVTVVDVTAHPFVNVSTVALLRDAKPERVLFKTGSARAEKFVDSFSYIAPEAAIELVELGIRLVGLDTPSVDPSDSKSLASHKTLAGANVAILENLSLDHVSPGVYELIAFPLKLAGMDASPVRAVLKTIAASE